MNINRTRRCVISILMVLQSALALACQPCGDKSDEDRVNAAWKESEAIFVATVVKIEKFSIQDDLGKDKNGRPIKFEMPAERVRFRVDRVFKGNLKRGDIYVTETNLSPGSCGKSAANDPVWLEFAGGNGGDLEMFKQWLIYSWRAAAHELSDCSSLPLNIANGRGDIKLLRELASKNGAAP